MSSIAASLSLSITILSSKEYTVDCSATYDTEKISMDRRKDDMRESRNVVKFFF